jgi:hypothetical protein
VGDSLQVQQRLPHTSAVAASSVLTDSIELERTNEMLRWVADGVRSVVFAGDAMRRDGPDATIGWRRSPVGQGTPPANGTVHGHRRHRANGTTDAHAPALRSAHEVGVLDRQPSATLPCSACSNAADRCTSVGIVVEGAASLRHLSSLAKAVTNKHNVLLTIPICDDATAEQLAAELAQLPLVEWQSTSHLRTPPSRAIRTRCSSASALDLGNSLVTVAVAPISLDRNECFAAASKYGYDEIVANDELCRREQV